MRRAVVWPAEQSLRRRVLSAFRLTWRTRRASNGNMSPPDTSQSKQRRRGRVLFCCVAAVSGVIGFAAAKASETEEREQPYYTPTRQTYSPPPTFTAAPTPCPRGMYRNSDGRCMVITGASRTYTPPATFTSYPPVPMQTQAPVQVQGPTALCADGTLSYSQHRSGTCSHHGGVAVWYP